MVRSPSVGWSPLTSPTTARRARAFTAHDSRQEEHVAVRLRLMRMGKKKQPTYRIVAADARSPRNGRFIEVVGTYDPRPDPSVITVDNDKAVGWLRKGAQPTERVEKLLKVSGAWDEFKGGAPS